MRAVRLFVMAASPARIVQTTIARMAIGAVSRRSMRQQSKRLDDRFAMSGKASHDCRRFKGEG
jgi:hypothetical protein